jgi:hypothetical protein
VKHGEILWDTFLDDHNNWNGNDQLHTLRIKTDTAILRMGMDNRKNELHIIQPHTQRQQALEIKIAGFKQSVSNPRNWYVIVILEAYHTKGMFGSKKRDSIRFFVNVLESRTQPKHKGGKTTMYTYFITDKKEKNGIDYTTLNEAIKEDSHTPQFGKAHNKSRRFSKQRRFGMYTNKNTIQRDFGTYEGVYYILHELIEMQGNPKKNVLVTVKPYPNTKPHSVVQMARESKRMSRRASKIVTPSTGTMKQSYGFV